MDADLRRLIDREAIVDLYARFAAMLDACEWESLRQVFTGDSALQWSPTDRWEGIDRIVVQVRELNAVHTGSHRMMSNHRVAVDGDRARAVALYRSAHLDETEAAAGDAYRKTHSHEGWYLAELLRTSGGWRFAHLRHESLTSADILTPQGRRLIAEIAQYVE